MNSEEEKFEWEVYQLTQLGMTREVALKVYETMKKERDAVWQYLVDHTAVQPNGYMGVQLYYRNRKDFERRLQARKDGDFSRYDIEKKERVATTKQNANIALSKIRSRHGDALYRRRLKGLIAFLYDKYVQKNLIKNL